MRIRPLVRAVSSDFDGPIAETLIRGLESIKIIAGRWGLPYTQETEDTLVFLWGLKGRELIAKAFGISLEEGDRFYLDWIKLEEEDHPPLIEGAPDALRSLRARGLVISVLTSRPSFGIQHMFDHHQLDEHFMHVGTTCGMPFHKPDERAFDCTVDAYSKLGITESEVVYVGDTYIDWQAGEARGIPTFIVRTGPMGRYTPDVWGLTIPDANIIDSIVDLEGRLLELGRLR